MLLLMIVSGSKFCLSFYRSTHHLRTHRSRSCRLYLPLRILTNKQMSITAKKRRSSDSESYDDSPISVDVDAKISLRKRIEYEECIKKSRFIARATFAASFDEAMAFINEVGDPKASHNCWAYTSSTGTTGNRCSDDGEPSGTAGRPILNAVESENMVNTVIVVTRYFGGIKLGAGGLIRAYGSVAKAALVQAGIDGLKRLHVPTHRVQIAAPLEDMGALYQIVQQLQAADESSVTLERPAVFRKLSEEYIATGDKADDSVRMVLQVDAAEVSSLQQRLKDACKGRGTCTVLEEK